jgi:hypothetical protein
MNLVTVFVEFREDELLIGCQVSKTDDVAYYLMT